MTSQPPRINPPNRIRRVLIKIDPAQQPNRIRLGKPSYIRIVKPEGVVVQAGLAVKVLTLKTQVLFLSVLATVPFTSAVAPGLKFAVPHAQTIFVGQLFRQSGEVGVEVQDLFTAGFAVDARKIIKVNYSLISGLPPWTVILHPR